MFRSSSTRYRHSLVAMAVATALASSAAWTAEDVAADDEAAIEEIIVTGTRRVGMTVDDSPAPVQIVTAEALQESGAPDLMTPGIPVPSSASQRALTWPRPLVASCARCRQTTRWYW